MRRKKNISIRNFIAMAVLAVVGILLCVLSFPIPFTDYDYQGFAKSISLGLDLKGGMEAVYEAKTTKKGVSLDDAISGTIERLQELLTSEGYSEATVTTEGSNRIRVEVPDVSDPGEVLDLLGTPAKLAIRKEKDVNAKAYITGDHIKNVESGYNKESGEWGVSIEFNAEGTKIFRELSEELHEAKKPIYIYLGDDEEPFSSPTFSEVIADGKTFISGSMSTEQAAKEYALKIKSGTFDTELTLLSSSTVSATLGADALKYSVIAGFVGLILIFAFMIYVYRDFGIIASFSLVFYLILMVFFLQAIPFVQLTLPGIAGIILSLGMAVDANVIIFERIKDEYRHGKRIQNCVQAGFKKALLAIVDSNVTTLIASVVLYILGTGAVKGFAVTLFLGIALSMLTSLLLTRLFVKWYLNINSTNPKRLNLKRGKDVNELG